MRLMLAGWTIAAIMLMPHLAAAQKYPEKSIRFIAPYAPGGSTDLLTRTLALKLTESLGQSVVAPAGTPKAIIDRLNAEIVKALNTPDMRQRLTDEGAEVEPSTPAELARFVHAEIAKWAKAVKDSGARVD